MTEWQLVMVCWGEKYGVTEINRLHRAARRNSQTHLKSVVITDRARPGLDAGIEQVDFPEFFLRDEFRGPGCQAKLAMFEKGVLSSDDRAVFVDLDSAILGDLGKIVADHTDDQIAILQSTALPAGRLMSWIYRMSNRRYYTRGNSSIVVFKPSRNTHVASDFRRLYEANGLNDKPTHADERFMSWIAQPRLRFIDSRKAVKFTREFMSPSLGLTRLWSRLPGTARRRAGLIFLTFNQDVIKPSLLTEMQDGEIIRDRRGRVTEWSDAVIGSSKKTIEQYFAQ